MPELGDGAMGLNVGSGGRWLHPQMIKLDLAEGTEVDIRGRAEQLPFRSASCSVVVKEKTLEHMQNPALAVEEMYRTLRPAGWLCCQVPLVIGYHPGLHDFWRFAREGASELPGSAGFECQEVGIAGGPSTGFYEIAVGWAAMGCSSIWSLLASWHQF
jgi:SAM-dependent methyltransferase